MGQEYVLEQASVLSIDPQWQTALSFALQSNPQMVSIPGLTGVQGFYPLRTK